MKQFSRSLARALMVVTLLVVAGAAGATPRMAAGAEFDRNLNGSLRQQPRALQNEKIDSSLRNLASQTGEQVTTVAEQTGLVMKGDAVQVQITVDPADNTAASLAVARAGGEVTKSSDDKATIQGFVPVAALDALAADPAVQFVRRPAYLEPMGELHVGATTTEGVAVTNANAWHSANQRGAGVKVAVIDVGFEGYQALLGGDLPASVTAVNFADSGTVTDGGPHGTACAEIVYDMAPGASLMLLRIATDLDVAQAIDYAISQGAHIISASIGTNGNTAGDGNNAFTAKVTQANNAGITYFNAAGNEREQHWGGASVDADGDKYLEVAPGVEINCFAAYAGDCTVIPAGYQFGAKLRWNNWSAPVDQDYDLLIVRNDGSGWAVIAKSEDPQNGGAGQLPFEGAVITTEGAPAQYGFVIYAYAVSRPANLDVFTIGGVRLETVTYARSLTDQAASPNVVAVAALDSTSPFPQENYSSEGPALGPGGSLTGGIVKPDIAAFANVNTMAYGTTPGEKFNGTSSATPHVAGAAALVKAANPSFTPTQVASFLSSRAVDMGASGKDTIFGIGRLWLGTPGSGGGGTCTGPRTRFDFNGDCRADILWRNSSTGANAVWYANGATITPNSTTRVADQNWRPVGVGDFNNDRKADILWRNNSTGANTIWFMNGAASSATRSISTVSDVNWRVVGTGDFNGDGRSDILWRHATNGANSLWALNSNGTTTGFSLTRVADLNWQVLGTGDFNGDGRADILWRNSATGANTIWFMNGSAATARSIRGVSDLSWKIVGTGDYNADNRSDILWRNTSTGYNSIWFMNGTAVSSSSILRVDDQNWQVAFDGDFNGDRKADILWRNNATGANTIWFMNGAVRQASNAITRVSDLSWRIIGNASAGTGASNGPFAVPAAGAALETQEAGEALLGDEPVEMLLDTSDLGEAMVLEAPAEPLPADGELSQAPGAGTTVFLPALAR